MLKTVVLVMCFYLQRTQQVKNNIDCGYKLCPPTRDGVLNVHLVAHSHMDAGWVKTFEEYYYGTRTSISTANVQLIYHSVLSELLHDKRRKFTFAETAYFWRWWKEQRPATRATFRTLVQEGRIEFAGGGWVQNDEATLDYLQIIDHYTWGLRKLNDTLGPCGKPKAAWQIDTYGHTREQASLLAQMGYDGLFIGRVDHKKREAMVEEDRMEFMWRGSDVLGKMSDIMTHTLYNLYNAPEGFCFDFLCSDEPIVDDPENRVYNAAKRVQDFVTQIERQARLYQHDNVLVPMGGDFTFQSAANWFMNMDKLISHVNTHPGNITDVNIFYSTPSCYLKAIYLSARRDKAVYTEKDDLLPYGSDPNTYWVGFYTSRPSLKYLVRRAHEFLQVVKQLTVLARSSDSFELHMLRHAVNLVLHHDAITGTSQQHVTNDYVRILSEAVDVCTKKLSTLLSRLTPTWGGRRAKNSQKFVVCHQLNISQCWFTEKQEAMLMIVYNPQSTSTYHHVCIPANSQHYAVKDHSDDDVQYQLVPLPAAVINLPGRISSAIQRLCFEAENIPPLGYTSFYITPLHDKLAAAEMSKQFEYKEEPDEELAYTISNEFLKVTVNKQTGLLESISHKNGITMEITQNFFYYSQTTQPHQSGAYSFRPGDNRPSPITGRVSFHAIKGPLVKEIRQRFSDWITQVIRLYRGQEFVEFDWIVGPVPIGSKDLGKEVVSIFHTNFGSGGHFYTDSNGREMLRRTCWNHTSDTTREKKPVAACYHPVTSRICIQSDNASLSMCVLTDRTQGGTSYNDGDIELMIHRRLFTDDGFGLDEPLNEEMYGVGLVAKGAHRLLVANHKADSHGRHVFPAAAAAARRWRQQPWLMFTGGDQLSRRRWQNVRNKRNSLLRARGLPQHVHILSVEPWRGGAVLLRLENTMERGRQWGLRGGFKKDIPEIEELASKISYVTVNLRDIFKADHQIMALRETTLAGNQWLDDARQMDWSTRYVYNGSDDDILVEDYAEYSTDYRDEKGAGVNVKNIVSKEKYHPGHAKLKRSYMFDRRKRWIVHNTDLTDNIDENIINSTFDLTHDHEEYQNTTFPSLLFKSWTGDIQPDFLLAKHYTSATPVTEVNEVTKVTRLSPKKKHTNTLGKTSKYYGSLQAGISSSEEIASSVASNEDSSKNMNKRTKRKRKRIEKKVETNTGHQLQDSNIDITRSMFDMYYKPHQVRYDDNGHARKKKNSIRDRSESRPRSRPFDDNVKRQQRLRERVRIDRHSLRHIDGIDETIYDEHVGPEKFQRRRSADSEVQRSETEKPALEELPPANEELADKDEDVYDDDDDDEYGERRKRSAEFTPITESASQDQEHAAQSEPDYVITLRPTQIRTFVVWFEPTNTPFVI